MEYKKTVGVIGYGYVGQAVANFFKDKFDVRIYDAYKPEYSDKTKVTNVDLAVICVPTPMSETGHCDTSIVEDVISWINAKNILIKSTIPPGTTASLIKKTGKQICFSPEYIGEGKYEVPFWKGYPDPTDMKKHDFVIIGGEAGARSDILSFFKRVLGAEPRYFQTDTTTAELCKYMENAFLATKVVFVNEFYDIAQSFGVDFNELREMWLADGRIGRSHTQVFEDGRGFSGKCLPKDVNAIVHASINSGYTPELLKSVLEVNTKMNTKSKKN
jgi:UDPglucose 6-dehydrogenase